MKLIEGKLIKNSPYDTRVYYLRESNIQEYVIPRSDFDFIKREPQLKRSGVYLLIGQDSYYDNITRVYVGQTSDLQRRFTEHNNKKDFWETVVCFQLINQEFNTAETLYLEHLFVKTLLDYKTVELLENTQIPKMPYLKDSDIYFIDMLFEDMKLMLGYSGYHFFKEKKNDDYNFNYIETYPPIVSEPSEDYQSIENFNDNNIQETCSYHLISDIYSSEAIELSDGRYMILPQGFIKKRSKDEFDKIPKEYQVSINKSTGKIVKDIIINDLKTFSLIVTGDDDQSKIKKIVTFV